MRLSSPPAGYVRRIGRSTPAFKKLAQKLQLHARSEEELLYPAALLVGDVVNARK